MTGVLMAIIGLLVLGAVLVAYGTVAKNRWGINLAPVPCPRCGTVFPGRRQPQSTRQYLWGGGTCAQCGIEVDKWGREMGDPTYGAARRRADELRKGQGQRFRGNGAAEQADAADEAQGGTRTAS
jgi:hypothetical protein